MQETDRPVRFEHVLNDEIDLIAAARQAFDSQEGETEPVAGEDGISRCQIVMAHEVIPTQWQPRRPFQGWRYLTPKDAPADLQGGLKGMAEMPRELREELAGLGLL